MKLFEKYPSFNTLRDFERVRVELESSLSGLRIEEAQRSDRRYSKKFRRKLNVVKVTVVVISSDDPFKKCYV